MMVVAQAKLIKMYRHFRAIQQTNRRRRWLAGSGDPVQLSLIRTTNVGQAFQGFWRPIQIEFGGGGADPRSGRRHS